MRIKHTLAAAAVAAAVLAVPGVASADGNLVNAKLVGISMPGQVIGGVPGGGLPWVVANGSRAKVKDDGRLVAHVKGLLLDAPGTPVDGTTGPFTQAVATLVCDGAAVATTDPVPLSAAGDARIRQDVDVPGSCGDPVVLVRGFRNGAAGPWFARTM